MDESTRKQPASLVDILMEGPDDIEPLFNERHLFELTELCCLINNDSSPHSYQAVDSSNIKNPSILHNKAGNSHQMGSTPPAPSTTVLNPPKVGISVRKSKKYIPLPDNPPSPKISINPKVTATRSNPGLHT